MVQQKRVFSPSWLTRRLILLKFSLLASGGRNGASKGKHCFSSGGVHRPLPGNGMAALPFTLLMSALFSRIHPSCPLDRVLVRAVAIGVESRGPTSQLSRTGVLFSVAIGKGLGDGSPPLWGGGRSLSTLTIGGGCIDRNPLSLGETM